MLSPKQVSDLLNIPVSSLRRYAVDYADMLSASAAHEGKKRRYTDNDVLTLRRIRVLVAQKKTPDEVRGLLQVVASLPPDEQVTPPADRALAVAYPELLEQLEFIKSALASKDAQISELLARVNALEQAAQGEHERQAMPWYKRFFK